MSYVDSVITPQEKIIIVAKTHWFIYINPAIWCIMGLLILGGLYKIDELYSLNLYGKLWYLALPVFAIALYFFLRAWIYSISTELAVTDRRVIAKFGFIRRNTTELKHSKVESLQVKQSLIGRIFDFGTLTIIGSGGTSAPIPYIRDPLSFRSAALTQDEAQKEDDD